MAINAKPRAARTTPANAPIELPTPKDTPQRYSVAGALMSEMPLWARPGYLLRRLHQIHYALFFEECAEFEITPVQYGLLTTLSTNPDLDQNSIARELGIDRTNVADVLNRLSRRGLIERRRGSVDKRTMLARLTPAGKRVTKDMYLAMQRAQERLLEPLLPAERHAFISTLIRLIDENNHLGRTIFSPTEA
jgi:DNA-binding MarR family transcriptional regulator